MAQTQRGARNITQDLVHIDVIVTQVTVSIHKESLILLVLHMSKGKNVTHIKKKLEAELELTVPADYWIRSFVF